MPIEDYNELQEENRELAKAINELKKEISELKKQIPKTNMERIQSANKEDLAFALWDIFSSGNGMFAEEIAHETGNTLYFVFSDCGPDNLDSIIKWLGRYDWGYMKND